jgi:hypothetical protein
MNSTLEQQNFPEPASSPQTFASDPQSVVEKPGNPYYQNGVDVGYTAPAKWWNWLWNHISAWLAASKADRTAMQAEMLNVLSAASITPSSSDDHQLSKAIDAACYTTCDDYNEEEITEEIGDVMVTHKKNQPYVVGHTLYIPDTELL